jgi:hypothetical protein
VDPVWLGYNLYHPIVFCRYRAQFFCVRTQPLDLHQKKYSFYAKDASNSLQIAKIVVPLHRQSEMMTIQ